MKNLSLVVGLIACLARTASAADDPKKMFETATAEFNLGHYEKAASMYENKGYLRAQPQARNRGEVQKRIAELELAIEAKRRGQERPPNVPANVEPHGRPEAAWSPPPPSAPAPASQPRANGPSPSAQSQPQPAAAQPQPAAQPATATNEEPSSERPLRC